jgi:hypothetical protein
MSGTDLGPGPLGRLHNGSDTRAPVNMFRTESCCDCSIYHTRGHSEPFGAAGENGLHVLSETIGRFRHMPFTWHWRLCRFLSDVNYFEGM